MTLEELEAEAMKLDLTARLELVQRLTASVPTPAPAASGEASASASAPDAPKVLTDDERERLWLQQAMARSRELKERQIQTEPPDSQGIFRPPAAPAAAPQRPRPRRQRPTKRSAAKRPAPKRSAAKRAQSARRKSARKPARRPTPRRKTAKARPKPRAKSRRSRR